VIIISASIIGKSNALAAEDWTSYTILVQDGMDKDELGERIPLILVHGIHGNGSEDITFQRWDYWQALRLFFYFQDTTGLKSKYKLYGFFYLSDLYAIKNGEDGDGGIGEAFRNWVDTRTSQQPGTEDKLDDVPVVILAHSMGGLVSRAFMNEELREGKWAGQLAGNRVMKLITLATPHHGSPVANENCRDATNPLWSALMDIADFVFWTKLDVKLLSDRPNRSDLRWDNYDDSMDYVCYEISSRKSDRNPWLIELNDKQDFDNKIIAYAGYIDPNDPFRKILVEGGPVVIADYFCEHEPNEREQAIIASIGLKEGLQEGLYGDNDGLVPLASGRFAGHDEVQRRDDFIGYDHGEMKGDDLHPGEWRHRKLFGQLSEDLGAIYPGIIYSPVNIHVLDSIAFNGTGAATRCYGTNISYFWDFGDGETGTGPTPTHVYRQAGANGEGKTFTVSLRMSDETGATYGPVHTEILVKPYPISVSPEGSVSLYREYSCPTSSLVERYEWDYGDGTPVGMGSSVSHSYSTTGYYTVTLVLTLKDNTVIYSKVGEFVGPGERSIPGHTINGEETWFAGGIYIIEGNITIGPWGRLIIQTGVEVRLASQTIIQVNGTLLATGATFTAADAQNPWGGIWFSGAGASGSRLENCVIEQAQGHTSSTSYAPIHISESSPTITGCSISASKSSGSGAGIIVVGSGSPLIENTSIVGTAVTNGIYVAGWGNSPIVTGCVISGNSSGIIIDNGGGTYTSNQFKDNLHHGIYVNYGDNPAGNPVFTGNIYSNNPDGDLFFTGHIMNGKSAGWGESGEPIYGLHNLTVQSGSSLSIAPGGTVRVNPNIFLTVQGALNANNVRFTAADAQNPWGGIWFKGAGASGSRLENCVIEQAQGHTSSTSYAPIHISESSPTITGCSISASKSSGSGAGIIVVGSGSPLIENTSIVGTAVTNGIYVGGGGSPIVRGCVISGNSSGIYTDSSSAVLQGNSIANNLQWGLYYSGSTILVATNNNWGDASGPLDTSDDRASGGFYNPSGLGNKVSDHVLYYPWTGTSIGLTAAPAGFTGTAGISSIQLQWNANTEAFLGGYKIYYGTSPGTYGNPVILGAATSHEILGLVSGTNYYAAISSMNTVGLESAKSSEIVLRPGSGISVTSPNGGENWVAGSAQTITWSYTGDPGATVRIELLKGGSVVSEIASSTPVGTGGVGSCPWVIPADQASGSDYQIKVTSTITATVMDTSNSNFSVSAAPASISVTSPNSGESWDAGSTHSITWTYTGDPGATVKIELLKGGSVAREIASSTTIGTGSAGSFLWTIPADQASGNDYRIKIASTTTGTAADTSDSYFTISVPASVTVTSPNGGETCYAGSIQPLAWTYTGSPGDTVKILLVKGGKTVRTIAKSASIGQNGMGSRTWKVPANQEPGDDYKIKIVSTSNSACTDVSDRVFSIKAPGPLTLVAPNGGETWQVGSKYTIRWISTVDIGWTVKLELLEGEQVVKTIVKSMAANSFGNGALTWKVPKDMMYGSNYRIRVTSNANTSYTDLSDKTFTITGPVLDVTAPDGGENWPRGSQQTITWTYTGNPGGNVRIELLKAGVLARTITRGTPIGTEGIGSYSWTVPTNLVIRSDFQIRISHNTIKACADVSGGNFSVTKASLIATAGPDQRVAEAAEVRLSGANSKGLEQGTVSFLWSQLDGPQTELSSPGEIEPSFTAPEAGADGQSLTFLLTLTDQEGSESQDSCIVNVTEANMPPTAEAGPNQTVGDGERVELDGSASFDLDDGIAGYQWRQLAGPPVSLSDANAVQPTFTAPEAGVNGESLTFQVTVIDQGGLRARDTCLVNVTWVKHPPKANAAPVVESESGSLVVLDGSQSSDPDGNIASVRWRQLAGPPVTLSDPDAARTSFKAPSFETGVEELVFELLVTDAEGLQDKRKVVVTVTGRPAVIPQKGD